MTDYPAALYPLPSQPERATYVDETAPLDLLILSKDRACQLDGLLRSIRAFLTVPHRIHILYTSSNLAFERGYDLVRHWNPDAHWCEDGGTFRESYLELYAHIAAGPGRYLMPVMDDMIFIRPFTAQPLLEALDRDDDILAISLRLGENVTFCHPRNMKTTPPQFGDDCRWEWRNASPGYWNYPMSVDANIFRTAEMAEYIKTIPFGKAEIIEARMAENPLNRPIMVCERTPTVLNLAINRVQHSFPNRHGGINAEALNGSFLAGFAMDIPPLLAKTYDSCHVEVELPLVPDRRRDGPHQAARSSPGWCPSQRSGTTAEADGDTVIVALPEDTGRVSLDGATAAIWQLCDGTRTVDEIENELAQSSSQPRDRVRQPLRKALDSLQRRGLLGYAAEASGTRTIDLREIPCFVINCREDTEKRRAIERQLAELEIPFEIVRGIRADPGWVGVALAHLKVLRLTRATPPFLVLEDDCVFNERFQAVWDVPAEADALYLGVSEFGLATPGEFSWGKQRTVRWEPYSPSFLRVFNMLARHAVVYLKPEFCEEVIQSQISALTNHSLPYPGDIGCTMLQASHVVLTPNDPICRQATRDSTAASLRQ